MNVFDIDDTLKLLAKAPAKTRTKVQNLMAASAAAMNARSSASDAAREDFQLFTDAEREFLRRNPVEKSKAADGRPIYSALHVRGRKDADAEAEIARLARPLLERFDTWQFRKAAAEKQSAIVSNYAFLFDVKTWLPGKSLKASPPPAVSLAKGQNAADAVHEIRTKLDAIDNKVSETERAPAPIADLIARMDSAIDGFAAKGATKFRPENRTGAPFDFDPRYRETASGVQVDDLFWIFADEIKAKMAAKIKAEYVGTGISDSERAAKLKELAADKLFLERQEESLICLAAEAGQTIVRRRDADPRAILEVECA